MSMWCAPSPPLRSREVQALTPCTLTKSISCVCFSWAYTVDRIFEIADTNGDGVLDFKEFSSLYLRHKASDDYADKELEEVETPKPNISI